MYYFAVIYGHFEDKITWFVVFYVYGWDYNPQLILKKHLEILKIYVLKTILREFDWKWSIL